MILSFRTDMPGQTVQTQIRLLLEEQSDQGLHCLPFRLHRLDSLLYGRDTHSSNFRVITTNFLGVRILRKFTVTWKSDTVITTYPHLSLHEIMLIWHSCYITQCRFQSFSVAVDVPLWNEPPHDKTNNVLCAQRRLRSAWASTHLIRVFAVSMKKAWALSYPLSAQRRLWSDLSPLQWLEMTEIPLKVSHSIGKNLMSSLMLGAVQFKNYFAKGSYLSIYSCFRILMLHEIGSKNLLP